MSRNKLQKSIHENLLAQRFSGITINRDGEYVAITQDGQIFWIHPNAQGERVWTCVADYDSDQVEGPVIVPNPK